MIYVHRTLHWDISLSSIVFLVCVKENINVLAIVEFCWEFHQHVWETAVYMVISVDNNNTEIFNILKKKKLSSCWWSKYMNKSTPAVTISSFWRVRYESFWIHSLIRKKNKQDLENYTKVFILALQVESDWRKILSKGVLPMTIILFCLVDCHITLDIRK